jgi:hypothetical protein
VAEVARACTAATQDVAVVVVLAASVLAGCTTTSGTDPCGGVACSGRGFCVVEQGEPYCACIRGYHAAGLTCVRDDPDHPCAGVDCSAHGTCRVRDDRPTCDCDAGYRHAQSEDGLCGGGGCDLLCVPGAAPDADAVVPEAADDAGERGADADADPGAEAETEALGDDADGRAEADACGLLPESCNGADDDCDGTTDEGFECVLGTTRSCSVGTCSGTETCVAGCAWGACSIGPADHCANGVMDCDETGVDCGGECGACCEDDVPGGVDALNGSGSFLTGMTAGTFCKAGEMTFRIVDVPDDDVTGLEAGSPEYLVLFALSDTANRNYAMFMTTRRRDPPDPDTTLIVKPGGGSCIDCACCACVDGWCSGEVGRPGCPTFAVGSRYTLAWDSDAGRFCFRRGSGAEQCFTVTAPFAFNKYCGVGDGCSMMHWLPGRWAHGDVALDAFSCSESVTEATASCP